MGDRTSGHLIEQRVSRREAPILLDWHRNKGDKPLAKKDAIEFVGSKRLLTSMLQRKLLVEDFGGDAVRMAKRGDQFATMLLMRESKISRTRDRLYDIVVDYEDATNGLKVRFSARTAFGKMLMEMHEALGDAITISAAGVADVCRHMRNDGAAILNKANRKYAG